MKIEKLVYKEYRNGKQFPANTVIMTLDNKVELACSDFHFYKGKLLIYVFKPFGKWKAYLLRDNNTKIMYDYFCKGINKNVNVDCKKLMKHECVHKKSSGGSFCSSKVITDYECAKIPLHDFRRSKYVQWN